MPGSTIAVRQGKPFNPELPDMFRVSVTGAKSGVIPFSLHFSGDLRTLYIDPRQDFAEGERIEVDISQGLTTRTGEETGPIVFHFYITPEVIHFNESPHLQEFYNKRESAASGEPMEINKSRFDTIINSDPTLPEDFPQIKIQRYNNPPGKGYYFIAPSWGGWVWPDAPAYLIMLDHWGTPVFYQKSMQQNNDLRLQANGSLSYWHGLPDNCFFILNSQFNKTDEYRIQNGYSYTDHHDFILLENGHAFIMTVDPQIVGMDTVVTGGNPNATVIGFVFQELDENKDVIFQWRSWDHYEITDAAEYEDLTADMIDYVHGNTIEVESDTSILISARNIEEITKIHRGTGEIIWRLGGKKNQFTMVNDPLGFSQQHDIRRLSNGNVSLFDNGFYHPEPIFSSVIEYALDEENLEAILVRRIRNVPDIIGVIMGNAQEIEGGGFVTGWGSGEPGITEFHPDGSVALEVWFNNMNYRAYRFEWENDAFEILHDTIDFGEVSLNSSDTLYVSIKNNMDHFLKINHVISRTEYFSSVSESLPAVVLSDETGTLRIKFEPDSLGAFEDVITICNNVEDETLIRRIAKQVTVKGIGVESSFVDENTSIDLHIYPNPSSEGIFSFSSNTSPDIRLITVYNLSGIKIYEEETHSRTGIIDLQSMPDGIYILKFSFDDHKSFQTKVIKN